MYLIRKILKYKTQIMYRSEAKKGLGCKLFIGFKSIGSFNSIRIIAIKKDTRLSYRLLEVATNCRM